MRSALLTVCLMTMIVGCGDDEPEKKGKPAATSGTGGGGTAGTSGTGARGGTAGTGARGGTSGTSGTGGAGGTSPQGGSGGTAGRDLEECPAGESCECDDDIDNDGDGLVDWEFDLGCTARNDASEGGVPSGTIEGGWTVFEPAADMRIVYLAADGNDSNDGLSPTSPKRNVQAGVSALRAGSGDWLLFRRGDSWQGDAGQDFQSVRLPAGRSATQPTVLGTYGSELSRPTLTGFELGHSSEPGNVAVIHIGFQNSAVGLGGGGANLLVEGCYFQGRGGLSSVESKDEPPRRDVRIRRNVATLMNTPFYFGNVNGLLIEENVIYRAVENGQGNHCMYITRVGNSNVTTRANVLYCGRTGEGGNGILQRPGGLAENNIIAETNIASFHFGQCNDGNDDICEPEVEASAIGNLIVAAGGIYFDPNWVTGGEARDNICADIPAAVDRPIEGSTVTMTNNVEMHDPADPSRSESSVLGLYSADALGGGASTEAFFEAAVLQQKFGYRPELGAVTVIDYVRENYTP